MAQNPKKFEVPVVVNGNVSTTGQLNITASAGDEGGQIFLANAATNTAINSGVNIDIYQNKLRFWEAGGTNRGYYVDITSGGAGVGTSLTGGSTGAMNYAQTEGTKQSAISSVGTTIVSVSITTNGYPVLVSVTGDVENNSAGGWVVLQLYRGATAIGNPVHAESSAGSENVPYGLSVVDAPAAGTYTYALKLNNSAGGTFNFGESDGPVITAIELSGPKGDTGAAGTANSFATISTPSGTSPVADSSTDTLSLTAGTGITITGDATADSIAIATNAASANGASTIVLRNASGDFAAGSITATLIGTASYATTINAISQVTGLQTALDDKLAETPTLLGGSEDLNTKTTPGLYHQNSNADAGTGTNYPAAQAGMLYVMVGEGFYYQTYQTYGGAGTNRFFHRGYYNTTWSAWEETIGTGDTGTVTNTMLAGSIANSKLANTAVSLGSQTLTLGAAATTALSGLTGVSSTTFTSTVATGTAPFTVSSTTMVTNLNADMLEGYSPATTNTINSIVLRDASGGFSAGAITAASFSGSGASLTNVPGANVTGTLTSTVLANSTTYVGNTAVALYRAAGNQALTGISSVTLPGSTSGTIQLLPTAIAGTGTVLTLPATTGTVALTSQIPTVNDGTLTLAVSGTGLSGSASFTANQSGATTFTVASNASSANGASTIVARDAFGSFTANNITGNNFIGSGALLSGIPAANISGTMSSALNLRTGSTGAGTAPIYMTGGGVLNTPVAGAVEYDGTVFYKTPNAVTGRAVDVSTYYYVSDGAYNVDISTAGAKPIFGSATTGLTIAAGTTYEFELMVFCSVTFGGTTVPSYSHSFLLTAANGTPTTTIYQQLQLGNTTTTGFTTPVTLTSQRNANNGTVTVLSSVTTGSRYATYISKGIIRVTGTAGHTVEIAPAITPSTTSVDYGFIPQAGSYFKITPIGNGTVAGVGTWA